MRQRPQAPASHPHTPPARDLVSSRLLVHLMEACSSNHGNASHAVSAQHIPVERQESPSVSPPQHCPYPPLSFHLARLLAEPLHTLSRDTERSGGLPATLTFSIPDAACGIQFTVTAHPFSAHGRQPAHLSEHSLPTITHHPPAQRADRDPSLSGLEFTALGLSALPGTQRDTHE